jgi:RNA polymerase II subunit A C-terminal domain phosphatase
MADESDLHLPRDLPYPITVVDLHAKPAVSVRPGTRLLTYSFLSAPANKDAQPDKLYGTWDCPVEGTLARWNIQPREVVSRDRARQRPAVFISEPCKHGVQMGGLCALCGKDMTECAIPLSPRPTAAFSADT